MGSFQNPVSLRPLLFAVCHFNRFSFGEKSAGCWERNVEEEWDVENFEEPEKVAVKVARTLIHEIKAVFEFSGGPQKCGQNVDKYCETAKNPHNHLYVVKVCDESVVVFLEKEVERKVDGGEKRREIGSSHRRPILVVKEKEQRVQLKHAYY